MSSGRGKERREGCCKEGDGGMSGKRFGKERGRNGRLRVDDGRENERDEKGGIGKMMGYFHRRRLFLFSARFDDETNVNIDVLEFSMMCGCLVRCVYC